MFISLNEENSDKRAGGRTGTVEKQNGVVAKEKLPRVRELVVSFFRTAGMPSEANK